MFRGSLRQRLTIGFLVVAIPGTLVLGIVTIYSIRSLFLVTHQLEEITLSLDATRNLQIALTELAAPLRDYLVGGRNEQQQAQFNLEVRAANDALVSCSSAACHATTLTPRQMAARLSPTLDRLRAKGAMVLGSDLPETQAARLLQLEDIDRLIGKASAQLGEMSNALVRRVEALRTQSHSVSRQALVLTVLLTLAITATGCAMATELAKRISRPIQDLLLGTRRVTAGDWVYRVAVRDSGEIGELASSFNAMVDEVVRHREQLAEHGRTLEARVRERTEELKRKDEALAKSEKLASLGLLASGVAHELNNPLTSILMNANLMMEEVGESSPLYESLGKITGDAGRCQRIIEDLRVFSRRRELQRAWCSVEEVVAQSLRLVQHELDQHGIRYVQEIPCGLPQAFWDSERIIQVLTNLFLNAAHAMSDGGELYVGARQEADQLILTVRDTGIGIPRHLRSRIMDPFFTTKPRGTGLGLSITHGIVQEHGGSIDLESVARDEAGPDGRSGTTIRIELPLSEERT